jgi:hypothetical protein
MPPILMMINLFIYHVFISSIIDVCYHAYFGRSDLTIPLEQTKDFRRTFKCLSPPTVALYTHDPSMSHPFETHFDSVVDEPQLSNLSFMRLPPEPS